MRCLFLITVILFFGFLVDAQKIRPQRRRMTFWDYFQSIKRRPIVPRENPKGGPIFMREYEYSRSVISELVCKSDLNEAKEVARKDLKVKLKEFEMSCPVGAVVKLSSGGVVDIDDSQLTEIPCFMKESYEHFTGKRTIDELGFIIIQPSYSKKVESYCCQYQLHPICSVGKIIGA